jgi:lipoprotein-releasing system ATP-binding protein
MLSATAVSKSYETARGALPVLDSVDFVLQRGEAAVITGPSGSGKSTLLYILGALDPPTSGTVTLDGIDPYRLPERQLSAFRNKQVGFVFQDHCLMPQCSVLENVLIPTLVAERKDDYGQRAIELLEAVGLADRSDHLPSELSGGEKQRAAIARALIAQPSLVLCDEPTGNLDRKSADTVAGLLLDLHRERNTILLVVTHSEELAKRFDIRYDMADRKLSRRA